MKIVLPFFSGDTWLLLKNLDWMKELDGHLDYDAVLACDEQTQPQEAMEKAKGLFRSVVLCRYPKATWNGKVMTDWPWQQNNSFANAARFMARQKDPWFWCETDCTPLRSGWLKTLETEYRRGGKPFGGHWNAEQSIFNGVAIYPARVSQYCPEALGVSLMWTKDGKQEPWDVFISPKVRQQMTVMNHVMQHLWRLPGQLDSECPVFPDLETVTQWLRPGIVLFHRCKNGSLIDRIRELNGQEVTFTGKDVVIPTGSPGKATWMVEKPVTDIFIVTYRKDLDWYRYCQTSIHKYAQGFNRIVVAVPECDRAAFEPVTRTMSRAVLKCFNEQPGKGMLHHEAIVCMADIFCDADYILHMDSDCLFHAPVKPSDYFQGDKPILFKGRFDALPPVYLNWQKAVQLALGFSPEYETMRRHPAVHPRGLYAKVRQAVEAHTGRPFLDYVLSCRNEFPQTFAEYPVLGAWALAHEPDLHHWVDVSGVKVMPDNPMIQFWSHGGFKKVIDDTNWGNLPKQYLGMTQEQAAQKIVAA